MTIDVKCSGCGAEFSTNDEYAGQMAECPDCGHEIRIPESNDLALEPEPVKPETSVPAPVPSAAPPAPAKSRTEEAGKKPPAEPDDMAKRARARMVQYFRIALVVAVALAMVKIFDSGIDMLRQRQHYTPQTIVDTSVDLGKDIQSRALQVPQVAPIARHATKMGKLRALTSTVLIAAMLLLAFRLLLRNKMLDAMWVVSPHWQERSLAGVTFYFFTTLVLVGLLAFAASLTKVAASGDGLVCGLLGAWLIASSLTALVAHVTSGKEFPHVTGRMLNDLIFGAAILGMLAYGNHIQMPARLSRVSVTSLLVFLNFSIEMTMSSVFLLESPAVGRFSRRFGFMLFSVIVIGGLGYLLHLAGA